MAVKPKFQITEHGSFFEILEIPNYINQVGNCVAQFLPKSKIAFGTWIPSFDTEDCVRAYISVQKWKKDENGGISKLRSYQTLKK